jgi:hypothetical protein
MRKNVLLAITAIFLSVSAWATHRAPLQQRGYEQLPLGSIKADGWLLEQLNRQATGLTGHLDEVYPQVMGPSNAWLGGDGDAWERGPYWIDGLLPLAYILDDKALKAKAQKWLDAMLDSQQEDGYFGPAEDHPFVYGLQRGNSHDWWPKMVALKILQQYYMATQDKRVVDCLSRYFRYQYNHLPEKPLNHWSYWGKERGADNLEMVYWLYDITGEKWLLELGELIHSQTKDWSALFREGSIFYTQGSTHTVNLAQGFKAPVIWWQYSGSDQDLLAPRRAKDLLKLTAGFPTGLWAGDEMLQFGDPTRGCELCEVVEMMFSLEEMLRLSGEAFYADWLERVAFNALPTQVTDDCGFKQYYQQVNQISIVRETKPFSTPHYDTDHLFGTLSGYPCCLSNMHQGWPKFVQNLWYGTQDGGLAALVYGPSAVTATVGGTKVRILESTDYPFRETVTFKFEFPGKGKKAQFPLEFRIPEWSKGCSVSINGAKQAFSAQAGVCRINRTWKEGDEVSIAFEADVEVESWYGGSWTFVRGPLVYALKMEEEWSWKAFEGPDLHYGPGAWEVRSSTPWNYAIMRDEFKKANCSLKQTESVAAYPWNLENAPLTLTVPARVLLSWKQPEVVAYWTEAGYETGDAVNIELIPYGCTTLRVTEFPTRKIPWNLKYRQVTQY